MWKIDIFKCKYLIFKKHVIILPKFRKEIIGNLSNYKWIDSIIYVVSIIYICI